MANKERKMNTAKRNEEDYRIRYFSSTTLKGAVNITMDLGLEQWGRGSQKGDRAAAFGNSEAGTDSALAVEQIRQ